MSLTIVRLYHELLGTYGDAGNAEVLIHRAKARGIAVDLIEVEPHQDVPTSADIYLLGGGEDGPQTAALEMLEKDGGLKRAAESGATIFAVCAGFQIIGSTLPAPNGLTIDGLGLVDAHTMYDNSPRSVGELVIRYIDQGSATDVVMTGFENHQGLTRLGASVQPLGFVLRGIGNGLPCDAGPTTEGAHQGNIFGTYMHGPALARNPELADLVLSSAVGELASYQDDWANKLAAERRNTLQP